jgi:hypothetical protein
VGCSRLQYSTGLRSIPCLNQSTTQKLSKTQSIERLDNGDQWTVTACRLLPLRHIHRATEINHDRHQSGCMMYGRKSNRWRHEYQPKGLLLGFFILFKLQSPGIWCTKMSLSTSCYILQNILNEWPDSDNPVWVAACLRKMMIGLLQVDATIRTPSCSTQTSARLSLHMKCCKVTAIFRQDILAVFEIYVYKEKKHDLGLYTASSYM